MIALAEIQGKLQDGGVRDVAGFGEPAQHARGAFASRFGEDQDHPVVATSDDAVNASHDRIPTRRARKLPKHDDGYDATIAGGAVELPGQRLAQVIFEPRCAKFSLERSKPAEAGGDQAKPEGHQHDAGGNHRVWPVTQREVQ